MSRTAKPSRIAMPTPQEDKVINAAAKSDPDALPLTSRQLKSMVPTRGLRGRAWVIRCANTSNGIHAVCNPVVVGSEQP